MSEALGCFTERMDSVVAGQLTTEALAEQAAGLLADLLRDGNCLPDEFRGASRDKYAQHIVHRHPEGAYTLVSLVWLPGQSTPIHDHRCWCVVGVLEGTERETNYHLTQDGAERWLVTQDSRLNQAGAVSRLVPPQENIHQVANAGQGLAISLHIYGADIGVLGSSINEIFDEPVRSGESGDSNRLAWRTAVK